MFYKILTLTLLLAFLCSCTLGTRKIPKRRTSVEPVKTAPVYANQTTVLGDFAYATQPRLAVVAK